jgi:hypothetical protein
MRQAVEIPLSIMAQPERRSNNSFNPTALSLPFINIVPCDATCVVSSGGGLIRALDFFLLPKQKC